jgi:hypothetical protein
MKFVFKFKYLFKYIQENLNNKQKNINLKNSFLY